MSRTLTNRNPHHPHNRLKSFLESVKAKYRTHTTAELDVLVNFIFSELPEEAVAKLEHPKHRHHKLEVLLNAATIDFKKEWEQRYGWPFDDCYNDAKLRTHVKAMTDLEKQAEFPLRNAPDIATPLPPVVDLTKIFDLQGNQITRAEYDALPEDDRLRIHARTSSCIVSLNKHGLAGVLPSGGIVDRRLHPDSIPVPKNELLGVEEPAALAENPMATLNLCDDDHNKH